MSASQQGTSRRSFLKTTGQVAGASALVLIEANGGAPGVPLLAWPAVLPVGGSNGVIPSDGGKSSVASGQ